MRMRMIKLQFVCTKNSCKQKILSCVTVQYNAIASMYECHSLIKRNFKSKIFSILHIAVVFIHLYHKYYEKVILLLCMGFMLMFSDVIYVYSQICLFCCCWLQLQVLQMQKKLYSIHLMCACESAIYFTHHILLIATLLSTLFIKL